MSTYQPVADRQGAQWRALAIGAVCLPAGAGLRALSTPASLAVALPGRHRATV